MKIILIRPPFSFSDENAITKIEIRVPPVGISYIASYLKGCGHDVQIADMEGEDWAWAVSFFSGASADVVGISCLTGQHLDSFRLAKLAKEKMNPAPKVVLGGPHPSAFGLDREIISNCPEIDFIVRGEGEKTTSELLEAIRSAGDYKRVRGITFRSEGEVISTPDNEAIGDLDCLPFPDYSDFDFDKNKGFYDGHLHIKEAGSGSDNLRFAGLITSRGCPCRCQFCSHFWGNKVRFRSPENIFEEMKALYEQRRITHFSFLDDCFNIELARIRKLCRLMIESKLPWTWTAVMRVKPLDEGTLRDMKRSGCLGLDFGVESGSEEILRRIEKGISKEDIERAFDLTRMAGIRSKALLMVGNPGENTMTLRQTSALIRRIKPDFAVVSPTKIFPNSRLHGIAAQKGIIPAGYWVQNSAVPFYTAESTADQLRLYRLEILFSHYSARKEIIMTAKVLVLIIGVRIVMALGLSVDSVRNFCFRAPLLRTLLKRFTTA